MGVSDGGLCFTEPYYQRVYWLRRDEDQLGEAVFYLAPGADAARKVGDDMIQPNALIETPDG